jgi:hypothetical protein
LFAKWQWELRIEILEEIKCGNKSETTSSELVVSVCHPPKQGDRGGLLPPKISSMISSVSYKVLDPDGFSGFAFFLPPREDFFSYEEGCAFAECALVVEKDSWESSLSQMTVSITSSGHKPSLLHKFFFLLILKYSLTSN